MSRFRDPAARDRAWARYYSRRGATGLLTRSVRPTPDLIRRATYALRKALQPLVRC